MPKLNQIVALSSGKKTRFGELLTRIHHGWGKGESDKSPLSGFQKTYRCADEEGDRLPNESKRVQVTVRDRLKHVVKEAVDFYDVVHCHESGNATATANIVVDDETLLSGVPVGFCLFLEKQLKDLHTLVTKLPTLSTDREWRWDDNKGCYIAEAEETRRTQKVEEPIVLYAATKEHPAQTQMVKRDVCVGYWSAVHMSGAIPVQDKVDALERVERLQDAVKMAREEANGKDVDQKKVSQKILDFVFKPVIDRAEAQ